jgi:hypothetical protein
MSEAEELVCVRTCQGWHVAQIYKSKLEAAGLPVLLKYEALGLVYGITVDGLGQVRVMVPKEYAAEAEALLEDIVDAAEEEWSDEEWAPDGEPVPNEDDSLDPGTSSDPG